MLFLFSSLVKSGFIKTDKAIVANILKNGTETAATTAAIAKGIVSLLVSNATSGIPIIAKFDLKTHWRTTPFWFGSFIKKTTRKNPIKKANAIELIENKAIFPFCKIIEISVTLYTLKKSIAGKQT